MFYSPGKKMVLVRVALWGMRRSGKSETLKNLAGLLPAQKTGNSWLSYGPEFEEDWRLWLEYLPVRIGRIGQMDVQLELFSAQRANASSAAWLDLVKAADGIILVIDSRVESLSRNLASVSQLRSILARSGKVLERMPVVLQFNMRDLDEVLPCDVLERAINLRTAPWYPTVAVRGVGLVDLIKAISTLVGRTIRSKL